MERTLQPPRATLHVLHAGWLFMLIMVISNATPTTNGRPSLVLYVLDIDEKKDFLDIIKLALALKSSDSLAENQAESEWNPSTWIVRTGHTLLRPRVGKSFLFGRSWL
jgi:hypothetical protein